MGKVTSRITIYQHRVKSLERAQQRAFKKTAEALHSEVVQAQVMPRDQGTLQNESTFVDYSNSYKGYVTISSSTPYARRLYYHPEYNFSKDENSKAKGQWYEDWLNGGKYDNFTQNAFNKFMKREGGL